MSRTLMLFAFLVAGGLLGYLIPVEPRVAVVGLLLGLVCIYFTRPRSGHI